MKKQYIEVPLQVECSRVHKVWRKMIGVFLMPAYVLAAQMLGTPGITLHIRCLCLGVRLFLLRRISLRTCYFLICFPMDSTRYFEFHEVFKSLAHVPFNRYLDVSSPRIAPLLLLMQNRVASADLMNPDKQDLEEVQRFASALGLGDRCTFSNTTIEAAPYAEKTFDLITCISVLEHIPADRKALKTMWSLLRPGGRLLLTLPCMAQPLEQYISRNYYGVLSPDSDGYTFWQRYYDEERLHSVIFTITGMPAKIAVYGERRSGLFQRNANTKRLLGPLYPYWRESYMVAREYRYYQKVADLPGEGVVMLEFVKP